jgi:hypothetical protein
MAGRSHWNLRSIATQPWPALRRRARRGYRAQSCVATLALLSLGSIRTSVFWSVHLPANASRP